VNRPCQSAVNFGVMHKGLARRGRMESSDLVDLYAWPDYAENVPDFIAGSSMDINELISRLAVALGVGLLIGLERGWRMRGATAGSRAAGIRTFALSGLLGGVVAALARALPEQEVGNATSLGIVLGVTFAAYSAVIALFTRDENQAVGSSSATTAIAGMLTFALGAYAVFGDMRIAAGAAVAATALLASREELHGWVEKITWPEMRSAVVLLAMTFIGLPILPDTPLGPFGGVNFREVWLIAIVLAAISFLGYVAVRYFGTRRGLLLAAAAGGLASSTAVTIANARRAAAHEGSPRLLAAGVAVASAVMFLRVVGIVTALKPELLLLVAPALFMAALTAVGFAGAWMIWEKAGRDEYRGVKFRNPFDLLWVVGFAVFLGVVIVLGRVLGEAFGARGAVAGAIVVGLVDVDAVTVSMVRLTPATLIPGDAGFAILAAVASDTVSKIAIGAAVGRSWFAADLAVMASGCLAAGGAAAWLTFALLPP
jgi:uncharacterized membrane protein (DUF4010 family)